MCVTLMANLISATPAVAATIRNLDVSHKDGRYQIAFDVLLAADRANIYELVGNYRKWPKFFRTLEKTQLLTTFTDGRQRIKLTFRSCVVFICRKILQIKDVTRRQDGDVFTRIVPDGKYFESGWEHWRLNVDGQNTNVQYRAELVPEFNVMPLIGPWLLKQRLRRSLLWAAEKAEDLATQ